VIVALPDLFLETDPLFFKEWYYLKYQPVDRTNYIPYLYDLGMTASVFVAHYYLYDTLNYFSMSELTFKTITLKLLQTWALMKTIPRDLNILSRIPDQMGRFINMEMSAEEALAAVQQGKRVYRGVSGSIEIPYALFEEAWCSWPEGGKADPS
jgi:hypothetical protein